MAKINPLLPMFALGLGAVALGSRSSSSSSAAPSTGGALDDDSWPDPFDDEAYWEGVEDADGLYDEPAPAPTPPADVPSPHTGYDLPANFYIEDLTDVSPEELRVGTMIPWALVFHQMAFARNDDPYSYRKVIAHFTITPDGSIGQNHPITDVLNASSGFNTGGIAVEFAGNFPKKPRSTNPKDFYKPLPFEYEKDGVVKQHKGFGMDQLTDAQIESGRNLIVYLKEFALPAIGGDLTTLLAHRQSWWSRANDPGPDIYGNIVQWGLNELDLSDGGPGFTVLSGEPIPDFWRAAGGLSYLPGGGGGYAGQRSALGPRRSTATYGLRGSRRFS